MSLEYSSILKCFRTYETTDSLNETIRVAVGQRPKLDGHGHRSVTALVAGQQGKFPGAAVFVQPSAALRQSRQQVAATHSHGTHIR